MRALAGFFIILSLTVSAGAENELIGHLTDAVTCAADPSKSYALYVPKAYSRQRKWPVIFCFDPGARGRIPVERLQAAAEKYGYIVAGSLNSRNGPWPENVTAIQAMVRDVGSRLALDPRRTYTAGLSGGARVATQIALVGGARGVIACSAGFPSPGEIPPRVPFVFFGTTGTEDFNHAEMLRLDADLEDRKAVHRIVVFNGSHEWASAALLADAVAWLELQAMRTGTEPRDEEWIQNEFHARLAAVPPSPGLEQWRELKSLTADFAGVADTTAIARTAAEFGRSRELKAALKTERELDAREAKLSDRLMTAPDAGWGKSLAAELRPKSEAPEDSAERRLVRRAVAGYIVFVRENTHTWFDQADYGQAASWLELGAALRPEQSRLWFDLARAQAFKGDRKAALAALDQAATAGFADAVRLAADPAFAKLARDPAFQAALTKVRANPESVPRPTQ